MNLSDSSLGFYRTALNFGLNYNNVLLQGAQRVRHYQIEQIDAALADYNGLSKKLEKSPTQDQLMAIGSDLAGSQRERCMSYWSGLSDALRQNQLELAGLFQSQALEFTDGLKQQLGETPTAMPEPVAATLKMVTEVMHNTLAAAQQQVENGFGSHQPSKDGHSGHSGRKQQETRPQHH